MVEINFEIPQLRALREHLRQAPEIFLTEFRRATAEAGHLALAEVLARTPVSKGDPFAATGHQAGTLARSIRVTVGTTGDGTYARVGGDLPAYAKWVEFGTRPHEINARYAKALRWFGAGGSPVFAKSVHHPGTRAYRMFALGLAAAAPQIAAIFGRAIQRGLRRLKA